VHVTHDQEEAMTMADTIAVMNAGRIEQLGSPLDLYESPATAYVANFLGQSNLLHAVIAERREDAVLVEVDGTRLVVPADRCRTAGRTLLVGVRPEKLHLEPGEGAPTAVNALTGGIVTDASFTGTSTQYVVRLPSGQQLTAFAQNTGRAAVVPVGCTVTVSWDPAHTFGLDGGEDAAAGVERIGDAAPAVAG
jgi:spermidine/putrescine transport system ATP-binding protein